MDCLEWTNIVPNKVRIQDIKVDITLSEQKHMTELYDIRCQGKTGRSICMQKISSLSKDCLWETDIYREQID